jgi:predicted RecB family nuclease
MEFGQAVGTLARQHFANGVWPTGTDSDRTEERAKATLDAMEHRLPIFEATLCAERSVTRCDILVPDGDNAWRIVEVKSGAVEPGDTPRPEWIQDVAFQWMVASAAGIELRSAALMCLNKQYVFPGGEFNLSDLFQIIDVTELVHESLPRVQEDWAWLLSCESDEKEPDSFLRTACKECDWLKDCQTDLPVESILYLPGVRSKTLAELQSVGIKTIPDVPRDLVTRTQQNCWNVFQSGEGYVGKKLESALDNIKYPAAFVDFETFMVPLPLIPGTRPWQAVPFQWSMHWMETRDSDVVHVDFLAEEPGDPRQDFVESLYAMVKDAGSVLCYSAAEQTILKQLVREGVTGAEELAQFWLPRQVDLLALVRDHLYMPGFMGGYSIKRVISTLIPGFGYSDLAIQSGDEVAPAYLKMHAPDTPQDAKRQIARDLRQYCHRDTESLVRLVKVLRQLVQ